MPTPNPAHDETVDLWNCPCRECTKLAYDAEEPDMSLASYRAQEWPEVYGPQAEAVATRQAVRDLGYKGPFVATDALGAEEADKDLTDPELAEMFAPEPQVRTYVLHHAYSLPEGDTFDLAADGSVYLYRTGRQAGEKVQVAEKNAATYRAAVASGEATEEVTP
jgi:imidazolonepropionase-like amidohydrolase